MARPTLQDKASRIVTAPHDPTGTASLRARFRAELDRRWEKVRRLTMQALGDNDALGLSPTVTSIHAAAIGGMDRGKVFQAWIDEAMRQVVLGYDGTWTRPYLDKAFAMARKRASTIIGDAGLTLDAAPGLDREQALATLTITELQGICEAVSQQAVRAMTQGLLSSQPPRKVARTVAAIVATIGKTRGRMLANTMVVKAFSMATLDAYRHAGISRVGTVPERLPKVVKGPHGKTIKDAPSGPGSRSSREETPSARTIGRIEAAEERLQALGSVEVITAGDDLVCEECQDISDSGPYDIDEAESLVPVHANCRCSFVPADDARFASVHEDAAPITAAGVMFMTPEGHALFMRRAGDDHAGEWAIPAGGIEDNETPAHCAQREAVEETGHPGNSTISHVDRRTTNGVDFHTYAQSIAAPFDPLMNSEHDAHVWAPLDQPPQPLHPGLKATLATLRRRIRSHGTLADTEHSK